MQTQRQPRSMAAAAPAAVSPARSEVSAHRSVPADRDTALLIFKSGVGKALNAELGRAKVIPCFDWSLLQLVFATKFS